MPRFGPLAKSVSALAGAAFFGIAVSAVPADAGSRHHHGDALAAGVLGAIIGATITAPPPVYAHPQVVYEVPVYPAPEPVYVSPAPVYDKYFPVYDPPPVIAPAPVYGAPTYVQPDYGRHGYHAPAARVPLSEINRHRYHSTAPTHPGPAKEPSEPRVVTYDDTVGNGGAIASAEPWSADWYEYCRDRFRSFDPQTGTYMGFDGKRHFCVVR